MLRHLAAPRLFGSESSTGASLSIGYIISLQQTRGLHACQRVNGKLIPTLTIACGMMKPLQ
jgi:hypothetical protein